MKPQQLVSYVRDEMQHAWHGMSDQWKHFLQRSDHSLVPFQHTNSEAEGHAPRGNGDFTEWGIIAADLYEKGDQLVVRIEIPGLDSSELHVAIDGNELVVSGEKMMVDSREGEAEHYHFSEIAYGDFERRIPLPKRNIAEDKNTARYDKGVLTIELPYSSGAQPTNRVITVH